LHRPAAELRLQEWRQHLLAAAAAAAAHQHHLLPLLLPLPPGQPRQQAETPALPLQGHQPLLLHRRLRHAVVPLFLLLLQLPLTQGAGPAVAAAAAAVWRWRLLLLPWVHSGTSAAQGERCAAAA
jgi:hypothetical protein